jgi:hypothetical protein
MLSMNLFLKTLVAVCLVGFCVAVGAFGGCLVSALVALSVPITVSNGVAQPRDLGPWGPWILGVPGILGAILGLAGGLLLASRVTGQTSPPRE